MCPSCRRWSLQGSKSIHLSKSKACAQSRVYETLHQLADQHVINDASVFESANVEAHDINYTPNIDEGNKFIESEEHLHQHSSHIFHSNNLSSPNNFDKKSKTKKSIN